MPSINAGNAVTFNVGGEIDIVIGATTHTLVNKEPGTLNIEAGLEELREYTDGGVIQTPIKGDALPSNISIDSKMAYSGTPANDLYSVLIAAGTGGAPLDIASIQIRVPDDADASTGTSYTFADCWVVPPLTIREGRQFDMLQLRFRSKTSRPTVAAYS